MDVNFDGFRKALQRDFNRLVAVLDASKMYEGSLLVAPQRIEKVVDDMRNDLVTLMCLESESEGFKSIIDAAPLDSFEVKKEDEHDDE